MRHLNVLISVLVVAGATASGANPRDDTLAALAGMPSASDDGLVATVEGVRDGAISMGEPMRFRFRASQDGYLTVLYVDHNGYATVLYPGEDPEAARIESGSELTFPPVGSDTELSAGLPLGEEKVFAVATREPIPLDALGLAASPDGVIGVPAGEATALAQRLVALVAGMPDGSAWVAQADHEVVPARPVVIAANDGGCVLRGVDYTAQDLVPCLEPVRSIPSPKVDLNIKFEFGSANLTAASKRQLDEVATALRDPRIRELAYKLEGHTDDVGSDAVNRVLSLRRAEATRSYLTGLGVDASRLEPKGKGEAEPEVQGTTDEARARNRRVVIEYAGAAR